jgi:hypothetical protein
MGRREGPLRDTPGPVHPEPAIVVGTTLPERLQPGAAIQERPKEHLRPRDRRALVVDDEPNYRRRRGDHDRLGLDRGVVAGNSVKTFAWTLAFLLLRAA